MPTQWKRYISKPYVCLYRPVPVDNGTAFQVVETLLQEQGLSYTVRGRELTLQASGVILRLQETYDKVVTTYVMVQPYNQQTKPFVAQLCQAIDTAFIKATILNEPSLPVASSNPTRLIVAWFSPETQYWVNVIVLALICALLLQSLLHPPFYFLPLFFTLFLGLAMPLVRRLLPKMVHGAVSVHLPVAVQVVENILREKGLPYEYIAGRREHLFRLTVLPLEIEVSRPRQRGTLRTLPGAYICLRPLNDETEPHITSLRQAIEKAFLTPGL